MTPTPLRISTAEGTCPAHLFRPERATAAQAGVILYMDAFGPRPALDGMAARIAAAGYTVLVPDLFYRFGAYAPFDPLTAFGQEGERARLMGMLQGTSQAMTAADTGAFLAALSEAGATGPVGTVGYCMGGARAMTAAATYPERIRAVASLHGGNLASDAPDSPHLRAAEMAGARVYVGCAGEDRSFPPEQSARLAEALRTGGVDHMIENYVGCAHGWCVPDHGVFNLTGAERHWRRIMALFAESLA